MNKRGLLYKTKSEQGVRGQTFKLFSSADQQPAEATKATTGQGI